PDQTWILLCEYNNIDIDGDEREDIDDEYNNIDIDGDEWGDIDDEYSNIDIDGDEWEDIDDEYNNIDIDGDQWEDIDDEYNNINIDGFGRRGLEPSHKVGHVDNVDLIGRLLLQEASEDLFESLAKMLRYQSVDNGVEAGVGIGQTVRDKPQGIGCLVKGEITKPKAQDHYVVG
ncbi:hypothetical protein scyTo_0022364, partial [Scyliorhinus torazame]|nr:hypothetical protein [Scyliorhinus torazame]